MDSQVCDVGGEGGATASPRSKWMEKESCAAHVLIFEQSIPVNSATCIVEFTEKTKQWATDGKIGGRYRKWGSGDEFKV